MIEGVVLTGEVDCDFWSRDRERCSCAWCPEDTVGTAATDGDRERWRRDVPWKLDPLADLVMEGLRLRFWKLEKESKLKTADLTDRVLRLDPEETDETPEPKD